MFQAHRTEKFFFDSIIQVYLNYKDSRKLALAKAVELHGGHCQAWKKSWADL